MSTRVPAVVDQEVHREGGVPVRVTMELTTGQRVSLDLVTSRLTLERGEELTPRLEEWCLQIGEYLARMALAESHEERRKGQRPGTAGVDFLPRPQDGRTWWG